LWPQQAALKDICDSSVEEPVYHVKLLKNPGAETTLESTCVVSEFTSMQRNVEKNLCKASSAFYPSTKEKEKAESSSIAEALNDQQLPEISPKSTSPMARDTTMVLRNIFGDDPQAASETDSCSIAEMFKYTVQKNPLMDNTEEMSNASVSYTYDSCGASCACMSRHPGRFVPACNNRQLLADAMTSFSFCRDDILPVYSQLKCHI